MIDTVRKVPEGQTPLDARLGHRYLDVINEGAAARDSGKGSPYHGHSLEHCLHATGWVQRDLRLALDALEAQRPGADLSITDALTRLTAAIEAEKQRNAIRDQMLATIIANVEKSEPTAEFAVLLRDYVRSERPKLSERSK